MSKNRKGKPDYRNRNTRRVRPRSNRAQEHRATQSRTASSVRPTVRPAGTLLNLPKPPKGIIYHWVTRAIFGEKSDLYDDRINEGWKPIDPSTIPNSHYWPQTKVGQYGNCITIRGMVACQMNEAQYMANEAVYEEQARNAQAAVRRQNMGRLMDGGINDLATVDGRTQQDYINNIPDEF